MLNSLDQEQSCHKRGGWMVNGLKLILLLFALACAFLQYTARRNVELGTDELGQNLTPLTSMRTTKSSSHATLAFNDTNFTLPPWAQTYFEWHAEQRLLMSPTSNHRYLIYTCLQSDASCGGLSDRIKSLPYFIYVAAKTKRVYLIHWNRPCRLEEFLLPPMNGLDWTTPDCILHYVSSLNHPIVTGRLQDQHGGSDYYNAQVGPGEGSRAFRRSFRSLFFKCFAPTPPLASAIDRAMHQLQLAPGDYAAAHFRAKYNEAHPLSDTLVKALARNVINCASHLRRTIDEPIFFASDSQLAVQSAVEYRDSTHRLIIVSPTYNEPLHLDKATSGNPSDYYNVFVDLFVLSNAHCIAHGQGGYGRLAVLLSHNASCFKPMVTGGRIVECKWQ
ncbi:hypothetical protein MPSEU_001012500 [Mayamaea pseudoterrestris]|nr:hypothetical protein MPSEU_001012500 [Mayamaea pseudoterrestris]